MIIKAANRSEAKMRQAAESALTSAEALVVISVFAFTLLLIIVPTVQRRARARALGNWIRCESNLKQVALAFRIWEGDNGDRYPGQVYTNAAGAPQFAQVFSYFQVMSNELNNPKLLVCPYDKKHYAATNFTSDFDDTHVSYFMGMDADETRPQTLLAGDANLELGNQSAHGLRELASNQLIRWTEGRHKGFGNIAFGDGSVRQISNSVLQTTLLHSGLTTNKLLFP